MPSIVQCQCGRRYRLENVTAEKRFRCQQCGKTLIVRPKKDVAAVPEDELDLSVIGEDFYEDYDAPAPRKKLNRQSTKRRSTRSDNRRSNLIIRGLGVATFLVTFLNCGYYLATAEHKWVGHNNTANDLTNAVAPCLLGILGICVAWVGENPDPVERQKTRKKGIVFICSGIGAIGSGILLSMQLHDMGMPAGSTPMILAISAGIGLVVYGIIAIITGRDLRSEVLKRRFGE